jgi:hypothetical protein
LITTAVILVSVSPTTATTARQNSLGGSAGFFEDESNVLRWSGSLSEYSGLVVLESGHFNLPWGYHDSGGLPASGPGAGLHLALDQTGSWGTAAIYLHARGDDSDLGNLHRDRLDAGVALLYGRTIGTVQTTILYRHSGRDDSVTEPAAIPDPATTELERTRQDIGLGLRLDLNEAAYLDLAGEVHGWRQRTVYRGFDGSAEPRDTGELTSWNSFGLRARCFIRLGARTALVPLAEYIKDDRPLPANFAVDRNIDGRLWRLGCGLNFFPDTDGFLLGSVEYVDGRADQLYLTEISEDRFAWRKDWQDLRLRIGWETRLNPWVSVRGSGTYQHLRQENSQLDPTQAPEDDPGAITLDNLRLSAGLGIHLGPTDLDLALTDTEPYPGEVFQGESGDPETTNWLAATLRWRF